MRTLQEWPGHRDIKTTLIYADYAPSEHEAAWVEAAFRPRAVERRDNRGDGSRLALTDRCNQPDRDAPLT